jgi:hypothetical protein
VLEDVYLRSIGDVPRRFTWFQLKAGDTTVQLVKKKVEDLCGMAIWVVVCG